MQGCRLSHVTQLHTKHRGLTVLLRIPDFLVSNIGILRAAWALICLSQDPPGKSEDVSAFRPRPLPSSLPVHYSVVILPFDAWSICEIWAAEGADEETLSIWMKRLAI